MKNLDHKYIPLLSKSFWIAYALFAIAILFSSCTEQCLYTEYGTIYNPRTGISTTVIIAEYWDDCY